MEGMVSAETHSTQNKVKSVRQGQMLIGPTSNNQLAAAWREAAGSWHTKVPTPVHDVLVFHDATVNQCYTLRLLFVSRGHDRSRLLQPIS